MDLNNRVLFKQYCMAKAKVNQHLFFCNFPGSGHKGVVTKILTDK